MARAKVERSRGPEQSDPVGSVVCVERSLAEERLHVVWQDKAVVVLWLRLSNLMAVHTVRQCSTVYSEAVQYSIQWVYIHSEGARAVQYSTHSEAVQYSIQWVYIYSEGARAVQYIHTYLGGRLVPVGDWVDERVKVEGGQVGVLCLDEDHRGGVVPGEVHVQGQAVVEVGEGDTVLSPHWLPDDDLVDVVELIPVLLPGTEHRHEHYIYICTSLERNTDMNTIYMYIPGTEYRHERCTYVVV